METDKVDPKKVRLIEVLGAAGIPYVTDFRSGAEGFFIIPPRDHEGRRYGISYHTVPSKPGWMARESEELLRCKFILKDAGYHIVEKEKDRYGMTFEVYIK
jgi:hypothetical protein